MSLNFDFVIFCVAVPKGLKIHHLPFSTDSGEISFDCYDVGMSEAHL